METKKPRKGRKEEKKNSKNKRERKVKLFLGPYSIKETKSRNDERIEAR